MALRGCSWLNQDPEKQNELKVKKSLPDDMPAYSEDEDEEDHTSSIEQRGQSMNQDNNQVENMEADNNVLEPQPIVEIQPVNNGEKAGRRRP